MESGWNVWVWLVGVVLRRYIDFLILLIPTPLVFFFFFAAASLLFVHFLNVYIYVNLHNPRIVQCEECKVKICAKYGYYINNSIFRVYYRG